MLTLLKKLETINPLTGVHKIKLMQCVTRKAEIVFGFTIKIGCFSHKLELYQVVTVQTPSLYQIIRNLHVQ